MKEIKVMASKNQLIEFKKSFIWKDIVNELNAWKEGFANEQDGIVEDAAANNPSTASVLLHMGDLNGRKKAVDYMIGLIDVFISIKEEEKNVPRHDKAD